MRKKMGCLLALMALLSALTACGGDSAEDVSGTLPPETPMTLEDALMQAGMSDIQVEAGSMEFAGADHSTLRVTSTISEIPVYELMVCVKEGNYMGVITLASYLEDTTEEMAALFTALPQ